jgi:hypothetical protein
LLLSGVAAPRWLCKEGALCKERALCKAIEGLLRRRGKEIQREEEKAHTHQLLQEEQQAIPYPFTGTAPFSPKEFPSANGRELKRYERLKERLFYLQIIQRFIFV